LTAAARLHLSGDRLTDLRLQVLRLKAREHRLLVSDCALLERQMAQVLELIGTHLTALGGLGTLGAAEVLVEIGDPRRFRSADAFASYTGTAPIPASSAESRGHPVHHRLSRFGNRRLNAVLYSMAVTRTRSDPVTQTFCWSAPGSRQDQARRPPDPQTPARSAGLDDHDAGPGVNPLTQGSLTHRGRLSVAQRRACRRDARLQASRSSAGSSPWATRASTSSAADRSPCSIA
jgi:hypothetical protein